MELFPGAPDGVWHGPVWKKGSVKVDPRFDTMGAENKITRGNKPGEKLEKPLAKFSRSGYERFIEPSLHDALKSQGLSNVFGDFEQQVHLRVHHRDLFAPSPGTNLMVPFTPDFKIHDDLDPGFQNGGFAQEFVAVSEGDDVFGGGLDDGEQATCFFKIVLKINAALIEEGEPGHIKIFHEISMPDNVHGIQIVKRDRNFHLAAFLIFHRCQLN
jgi:hypothetical protein